MPAAALTQGPSRANDPEGSTAGAAGAARLTVGVVARDGLPFLTACLGSLPALEACAAEVEFILVDSASTDATLDHMLAFAGTQPRTRVFSMSGSVNAAAARNVILRHARPGAVFLVDGDVCVEPAFVRAALAELDAGTCDAAFGRLPEILYDGQHRQVGLTPDRYRVSDRRRVKFFMGIVLLGQVILRSGVSFDESQRRSQDFELSLRLADKFRILALPITMGVHHTISYYHRDRSGAFFRESYMRPMGQLLRKHVRRPHRLWALGPWLKGSALGLMLQLLLLMALVSGSPWLLAAVGGCCALDVARFAWQRRLEAYVPIRIISGWQILHGFVRPERTVLSYEVRCCWPAAARSDGDASRGAAGRDGAQAAQGAWP